MPFTLNLTDQADLDERKAIFDPLMAFNQLREGARGHHRPLDVPLRDDEGDVVGGLWGHLA